jgi:hypothetical protein
LWLDTPVGDGEILPVVDCGCWLLVRLPHDEQPASVTTTKLTTNKLFMIDSQSE